MAAKSLNTNSDGSLQCSMPVSKIPLTVICGFLGAGKTTLVKHILRNREGMKVGVVVNDVAAVNVDVAMVNLEDADGLVGLQNGCVCCSDRNGLVVALQRLIRDRHYDHLIVECTGVAEPVSISWELEDMVKKDDPLMHHIFLAGIVCLVDASTFQQLYRLTDAGGAGRRSLSFLLVSQIECSSTIILNKQDLVSSDELTEVSALVAMLNPSAVCIAAIEGVVPLHKLLPSDVAKLQDRPAYVPSLAMRHSVAVKAAQSRHDHGVAHDEAGHNHASHAPVEHADGHAHAGRAHSHHVEYVDYGIKSFVYVRAGRKFEPAKLAGLVRKLPIVAADLGGRRAWPLGDPAPSKVFEGVLRSKGFVRVVGDRYAYHWSHAGKRFALQEAPRAPGEGQELVFIGRGMDESAIVDLLDTCLEPSMNAKL